MPSEEVVDAAEAPTLDEMEPDTEPPEAEVVEEPDSEPMVPWPLMFIFLQNTLHFFKMRLQYNSNMFINLHYSCDFLVLRMFHRRRKYQLLILLCLFFLSYTSF